VKSIGENRHNQIENFTKKYNVKELVFFEIHANAESAITREKQIKKWRRAWKLRRVRPVLEWAQETITAGP